MSKEQYETLNVKKKSNDTRLDQGEKNDVLKNDALYCDEKLPPLEDLTNKINTDLVNNNPVNTDQLNDDSKIDSLINSSDEEEKKVDTILPNIQQTQTIELPAEQEEEKLEDSEQNLDDNTEGNLAISAGGEVAERIELVKKGALGKIEQAIISTGEKCLKLVETILHTGEKTLKVAEEILGIAEKILPKELTSPVEKIVDIGEGILQTGEELFNKDNQVKLVGDNNIIPLPENVH
jgi:hypothetical protein